MQKEKLRLIVYISALGGLAFFLSGCGKKLETREWRYPDGRLKIQGTVYREPPEGEVKHGLWTEWHDNGQKALDRIYRAGKLSGTVLGWYKNGAKELEGQYRSGSPHGVWLWWHENGQKLLEGRWRLGLKHGLWTWWYDDGRKEMEGEYRLGESEGKWTYWDTTGKKLREEHYRRGRMVKEVKF